MAMIDREKQPGGGCLSKSKAIEVLFYILNDNVDESQGERFPLRINTNAEVRENG